MGVMSKTKGARLPERPKPPSWEEIAQDVCDAHSDDVVFNVGKSNLLSVAAPTLDERSNTATNSSSSSRANSSDLDLSHTDIEAAQASYENVLRLISSDERLCLAPATLRGQYTRLQEAGDTMQASISQLRALQHSLTSSTIKGAVDSGDAAKAKSKHKKKK